MTERLAEFQRGGRETPDAELLRIGVREFEGRTFVEARIYYRDPQGTYRPTRKGVTFRAHEVAEAAAALKRALDELTGGRR